MKNKKIIFTFPLVALLTLCASCGETETGKFNEYYDYNWTPGESSLEASQPTLKNPKGTFTVINEMRRTQNKVGLPSQGEANVLVVPINFANDDQFQTELGSTIDITFTDDDLKHLNDVYFNQKSTYGYPSVSEYYKKSSFNKLNLSGVVSPVVTLPHEYFVYVAQSQEYSKQTAYNNIIEYVYNYLFEETKTYYIGDFDSDNDNMIDAISLVCNYPYNLSFSSEAESIELLHKDFVGPNNVFFTDSITDSKKVPVNSFSIVSDSFRLGNYLNHDSRVYISLIGQMIGLDNYEDSTINTSTGLSRAPIGYYDMMSGAIGDHNSFSKYQLGWIEPTFISADDIPNEGLEITINNSVESGDTIILHTGNKSQFGEYLMIDLYSSTKGINVFDTLNASYTKRKLFSQDAIRVYQVDSRLVRGYSSNYVPFNDEPNFEDTITLKNGEVINYTYNYAYTNNSTNKYSEFGFKNYALVSLLSKKGSNRHLTDNTVELTIDDMFLQGDTFGSDDQISGFYKDFSFHGNGLDNDLLNITFEVTSISNGQAKLTFRRTK